MIISPPLLLPTRLWSPALSLKGGSRSSANRQSQSRCRRTQFRRRPLWRPLRARLLRGPRASSLMAAVAARGARRPVISIRTHHLPAGPSPEASSAMADPKVANFLQPWVMNCCQLSGFLSSWLLFSCGQSQFLGRVLASCGGRAIQEPVIMPKEEINTLSLIYSQSRATNEKMMFLMFLTFLMIFLPAQNCSHFPPRDPQRSLLFSMKRTGRRDSKREIRCRILDYAAG